MTNSTKTAAKLLAVSAFVITSVFSVLSAGHSNASAAAGAELASSVRSDGGSDYVASCAVCHGRDGKAQTAKGKRTEATDLTKSSVSDEKGMRIIANGRGSMPAFKNSLSPERIAAVMGYIRGFRR